MPRNIFLLALSLFLLGLSHSTAQGWEHLYNHSGINAYAPQVLLTQDQHAVGATVVSDGTTTWLQLVKTDLSGNLIWQKNVVAPPAYEAFRYYNMIGTSDGGFALVGRFTSSGQIRGALILLNGEGEMIEWQAYTSSSLLKGIVQTADGGFLLSGVGGPVFAHLIRTDGSGQIIWTQNFLPSPGDSPFYDIGHDLLDLGNNRFLMLSGQAGTVHLLEIDIDGVLISDTELVGPPGYHLSPVDIIHAQDGGYWVAAWQKANISSAYQVTQYATTWWKLAADQSISWMDSTQATDSYQRLWNISENTQGDLFIAREEVVEKRDASGPLICAINTDGNRDWAGTYVAALADGGALIAASTVDFVSTFGARLSLNRMDHTCEAAQSLIQGQVRMDQDDDCNSSDLGNTLPNWLVELKDGNLSRYRLSDSEGRYRFLVNPGDYAITLHPPIDYWEACQQNLSISTGITDTVEQDLSSRADVDCPYLTVDLAASSLRPCLDRAVSIHFANLGTLAQTDAYIHLKLHSYLSISTSSIVYEDLGNDLYRFDVGTLAVGEQAQIDLQIFTDCDTEVGLISCLETEIFPTSDCEDNAWNGPVIKVTGQCLGEEIQFKIENIGLGDMTSPEGYVVIEDDVMYAQGIFELNAGASTFATLPNQHALYYLRAEQVTNYPFGTFASDLVAYCQNPGLEEPFSSQFFGQFSYDDEWARVDEECIPIVNSFDPNQKVASPIGFGEPHFIHPQTSIEYRVDFQNTGTDTAYQVVIRDTLSSLLDLRTLQVGASSHPYRLAVEGERVLVFSFDQINLPDSTTDAANSQGFISYKIVPEADLPNGSRIENTAAIYFDNNDPIITNVSYHTTQKDFLIVEVDEVFREELKISVFPNPARAGAVLQIQNRNAGRQQMRLVNQLGQQLPAIPFEAGRAQLSSHQLQTGIYFYQLWENGKMIGTGKIIIVKP